MSKVQPPELKKLMDKKLSGTRGKWRLRQRKNRGEREH
jgi:hypothetical protein